MATPERNPQAAIERVEATPLSTTTASAPWAAAATTLPATRIRLRDIRSARTPPASRKATVGTVFVASTRPSEPAPPPSPITA